MSGADVATHYTGFCIHLVDFAIDAVSEIGILGCIVVREWVQGGVGAAWGVVDVGAGVRSGVG